MKKINYENELNKLNLELEKVQMMGELEACEFCGSDTKDDAIECIQEEIEYYESKIKECEESEELEEKYETKDYWKNSNLDPAFSSWYQVNSMFV